MRKARPCTISATPYVCKCTPPTKCIRLVLNIPAVLSTGTVNNYTHERTPPTTLADMATTSSMQQHLPYLSKLATWCEKYTRAASTCYD